MPISKPEQDFSAPRNPAYILFILAMVYTLNIVDRQIIGILAVPIKADLGLSDTQLGLMGGLAFAVFYTGLGIPVALLADRFSRTWIMTIALATWSLMTAVCGLANSFWQLFLSRVGVGVGEAGGVAPAYSLIADLFPAQQRARAVSVYSFAIPFGTALGLVWLGPVLSTIQNLVQPDMRATASAVSLFIINLLGIGLGIYSMGALSDGLRMQFGDDSLRYSILTGSGCYLVAAVFFFLAARRLNADWEE